MPRLMTTNSYSLKSLINVVGLPLSRVLERLLVDGVLAPAIASTTKNS